MCTTARPLYRPRCCGPCSLCRVQRLRGNVDQLVDDLDQVLHLRRLVPELETMNVAATPVNRPGSKARRHATKQATSAGPADGAEQPASYIAVDEFNADVVRRMVELVDAEQALWGAVGKWQDSQQECRHEPIASLFAQDLRVRKRAVCSIACYCMCSPLCRVLYFCHARRHWPPPSAARWQHLLAQRPRSAEMLCLTCDQSCANSVLYAPLCNRCVHHAFSHFAVDGPLPQLPLPVSPSQAMCFLSFYS